MRCCQRRHFFSTLCFRSLFLLSINNAGTTESCAVEYTTQRRSVCVRVDVCMRLTQSVCRVRANDALLSEQFMLNMAKGTLVRMVCFGLFVAFELSGVNLHSYSWTFDGYMRAVYV